MPHALPTSFALLLLLSSSSSTSSCYYFFLYQSFSFSHHEIFLLCVRRNIILRSG
jgi:hypothetical protein